MAETYACIWYHFKAGSRGARTTPKLPDGWYFDGAENVTHDDPDEYQERYPMGEVYMGPKGSYEEALKVIMDALEDDKDNGSIEEYTFTTRQEYNDSMQDWKLRYGNRMEDSL